MTNISTTDLIGEIRHRSIIERDQILADLKSVTLPGELREFVEQYEHIPWCRDRILWQWVWRLSYARSPGFMLSAVPSSSRRDAALVKSLLVMAVTIVDDVADKNLDQGLLEIMLKTPFSEMALPADLPST